MLWGEPPIGLNTCRPLRFRCSTQHKRLKISPKPKDQPKDWSETVRPGVVPERGILISSMPNAGPATGHAIAGRTDFGLCHRAY